MSRHLDLAMSNKKGNRFNSAACNKAESKLEIYFLTLVCKQINRICVLLCLVSFETELQT